MDLSKASRNARWLLIAILLFAIGTRVALALSKSLVLDEFHSYFHATRPTLGAFLDSLRRDNHPPLSFLVIAASRGAFQTLLGGEEPHAIALRLPAILFGLLEIAVLARLVRRFVAPGAPFAAALAAAAVAASSLHLDYGTQARMYAPHALAVTVAAYCLLRLVHAEQPLLRHRVLLALALASSFHMHYFGVQYAAALFGAGAVGCIATGRARALLSVIPSYAGAALLSLPWILGGFRHQLGHGLAPGGDDLGLGALANSFVHLFVHNASYADGALAPMKFALAGAALVLVGCAALGGLRMIANLDTRAAGIVLVTIAFAVPLASWGLAKLVPRAGYTWHYVLPSTASMAALAAAGARGRVLQSCAWTAILACAWLCSLHLVRPATEDFRGAVRLALELADDHEDTRIIATEWQPPLFPQGQPYDYYAPALRDAPPAREAMVGHECMVQDLQGVLGAPRVVVVRRSLPGDQPLLQRLTETFGPPSVHPFGYGLDVRVFEHDRQPPNAPR